MLDTLGVRSTCARNTGIYAQEATVELLFRVKLPGDRIVQFPTSRQFRVTHWERLEAIAD